MNKTAPQVRLIHNPNAGQKGFSKTKLGKLIKKQGFEVDYASSEKRSLKDIEPETTFIAIAGGDGTIRKTIIRLLDKKLKYKRPIALLPMGTANNIATSLGISENPEQNIAAWKRYKIRKFDIGQISHSKHASFFLESFGYGVFPLLMKEMLHYESPAKSSTSEELEIALTKLLQISHQYTAQKCKIKIEDKLFEDNFLLVEVMNISRLGPNLKLAENADPSDGFFDVVMVRESQRTEFCHFLSDTLAGKPSEFPFKSIQTKSLEIKWMGDDCHGDDEIIPELQGKKLKVNLMHSLVEVLSEPDQLA